LIELVPGQGSQRPWKTMLPWKTMPRHGQSLPKSPH
jgi:hypothetical protein